MRFDPTTNRVYIRQSFLGDYLLCPQRAKYGITKPQMKRGSDATAIGTAVHAGIEAVLCGDITDEDTFCDLVTSHVLVELDKDIKHTGITDDMPKLWECVEAMSVAWWTKIRPHVPLGGLVEHSFTSPTGMLTANGMEIWFEGTIDYVAPDGILWDWKTSTRPYFGKEKQKIAHQPTVYIDAMRTNGVIPNGVEPTLFRFGVMVRQETPKAQIITMSRGQDQVAWIRRQTKSCADTAIASWGAQDWVMNDTSALCSAKWCDFWSICKGAHWTEH